MEFVGRLERKNDGDIVFQADVYGDPRVDPGKIGMREVKGEDLLKEIFNNVGWSKILIEITVCD